MIIPIKCFTCGTLLADKYRYYCKEVRNLKKIDNIDTQKVIYLVKNSTKTHEGNVLDAIGLNKMCCRRHMLTHVDID